MPLYFTRQAGNIIALTPWDSEKQLMLLPSMCSTGAENHTQVSVQNALYVSVAMHAWIALTTFGLHMHLFYVNSPHPPQVSMCLPSYLLNLPIIPLPGASMAVRYFCIIYTWMQLLCSLFQAPTQKYKTIQNSLF